MSSSSSSSAKTAHDLYTCPHLGMLDDTTTTTAFPSEVNHCLHCQSVCVPSRQQQQEYCLSQRYRDCPILHQAAPARLPASLRWVQNPAVFRAIFIKSALAVFGAGLLAGFFLLGAPARISHIIQAYVPEDTQTPYQPYDFPTRTPSPRPEQPSPTATSLLSHLEIPTALPISQIVQLTVNEVELGVNCRSGPDSSFESYLILRTGDVLQALARSPDDAFFYVRLPKKRAPDCWVPAAFVNVLVDTHTLPVLTPAPTPHPTVTLIPLPSTPTDTPQTPPPTTLPTRPPQVNTPPPSQPTAESPEPTEEPPEPTEEPSATPG